jgi:UDP-N-acetylglucosamine enolpyruvyl transferase
LIEPFAAMAAAEEAQSAAFEASEANRLTKTIFDGIGAGANGWTVLARAKGDVAAKNAAVAPSIVFLISLCMNIYELLADQRMSVLVKSQESSAPFAA